MGTKATHLGAENKRLKQRIAKLEDRLERKTTKDKSTLGVEMISHIINQVGEENLVHAAYDPLIELQVKLERLVPQIDEELKAQTFV